jgi:SsrA-binding protein
MAKKNKTKAGLLSTDVTVAENRRARYDYHLEERFNAGIVLTGTEIKSLRHGQCSLNESHVGTRKDEIFLFGAHIAEYAPAGAHLQHEPIRPRKLLLHRKEIHKLAGAVKKEGYTIVPTRLYFNARGIAKIEMALAKGKKQYDKRATEKDRDWGREKARLLRDRG